MKDIIELSVSDIETEGIKLIHLELDDLFEGFGCEIHDNDDLIFDREHYSSDNGVRLLECKNCVLGEDLYLLVFNNEKSIFSVSQTTNIDINTNKIKIFGWDINITISLKNGLIKIDYVR